MTHILGELIEVPLTFTDADTGDPVDPDSLHFLIKTPDSTAPVVDLQYGISSDVIRDDPGHYIARFQATVAGRYQWRAVATGNGQSASQGYVDVIDAFVASYAPSVSDVAAVLPNRPVDGDGNTLDTFTDATTPTGDQVSVLIDQAVETVGVRLPATLQDRHTNTARWLTTLYTAMLVELTYFGEQVPDQSPYEQYKALFDDGINALVSGADYNAAGDIRFGSVVLVSDMVYGSDDCTDELTWH